MQSIANNTTDHATRTNVNIILQNNAWCQLAKIHISTVDPRSGHNRSIHIFFLGYLSPMQSIANNTTDHATRANVYVILQNNA